MEAAIATDVERLSVLIEANTKSYERAMTRLEQKTDRAIRNSSKSIRSLNGALAGAATAARGFAGVFGVALGGQEIIRAADSFTRIQNALRVAGLEGEAAADVFDRLFAIAQKNGAPVESLATLYGRLALSQKEINASSDELIRFTEGIAAALRVSGSDAQSASGALLQLSQAISGGVVRAEEFNSMLEGGLQPALQAVANGLEEAGGSVARLRQLVISGEVSSEAFFRAFEAGQGQLERLAATADGTVGQAFERMRNEITKAVGKVNESQEASHALGGALDELGTQIAALADWFISLQQPIEDADAWLRGFTNTVLGAAEAVGEWTGLNKVGEALGTAEGNVEGRIRKAAAEAAAMREDLELAAALQRKAVEAGGDLSAGPARGGPSAVDPISTEDYAATATGKDKEAAARDRAAKAAAREAQAVKDLIADLEHELRIGSMSEEQQRIENELRRAGAAATGEQQAKIVSLVTAIQQQEAAMEAAKEAEEAAIQRMDDFRDAARDALSSFVADLRAGKTAAEAFSGVLDQIINKMANAAIDQLISGLFGTAGSLGGGGLGGLIGGLFGAPAIPALAAPAMIGPMAMNDNRAASPSYVEVRVGASEYFDTRVTQVSGAVSATVTRENNRRTPGMLATKSARGLAG